MARLAYVRVSTEEQDTQRQIELLTPYGIDKWYIDKLSGKNANRPQLQALLEYMRDGDVVYVVSYSRFSRSTADLLSLVETLHRKGVGFVSLHENVDTTTPAGKMMMTVFAGLAQYERDNIKLQQREGIEAKKRIDAERKARGEKALTYTGRQPIKVDAQQFVAVMQAWREGKITAKAAMQAVGLKPNTWYRRVKEYEANTAGK